MTNRFIQIVPRVILWHVLTFATLAFAKPILIANRDLSVFPDPRHGLFCQRGPRLGIIPKGYELADYDETTSFCGPLFSAEYLKIRYTSAEGKMVTGYVRRKENDGSDRFSTKP